ncbi:MULTISPECIES: maleylpyruvate isomerase family mycothiol-dependent enzyme [Streptomyces]|uniref:Putative Actinobacterial protein n=1 Tax=Streptomyces chartreusis NRRL 3882 TaxID=1079985 RepID=A0A2N9BM04_STRCX|nr:MULTISPECIES: maleylpyruvate isomerase family mycothiol-dependent enzyme [Streptomyces]MYS92944.1 maleylpyruvate isomerase family mycothiol-dependent enzyme [Streptomyces sp. SID5464]SOR84381.1 putative Actinobacterial protein [Streptomyces chartreusis NRRL 3882]
MSDSDPYWAAVRATRLRIADLLEELTPAEWEQESLCRGWRVRDVAGHLALVPTITTWDMVAVAPRARFSPDRINTVLARRHGSRHPADLVAAIRSHAGTRRTAKVLDTRNALFDAIVHGQDIALPLARQLPVPAEHSREGLRRVWAMGWPFHAERHLAGFTLRATDTDWAVGDGPEIAGPALGLLLLSTGRTACLDTLQGDGVDRLKSSLPDR